MKFVFVLVATVLSATALQAQQAVTSNPPNLPSYILGPSWFPTVLKPYQEGLVRPPVMENSPRLHDLIRNGKLRLSMSDALALAIENNLDIAVQRFLHPIAEADVLRASSGQAARGIPGALLPSGLSQGPGRRRRRQCRRHQRRRRSSTDPAGGDVRSIRQY
jgi:hypothetical protein